jgi:hypothetical protein
VQAGNNGTPSRFVASIDLPEDAVNLSNDRTLIVLWLTVPPA